MIQIVQLCANQCFISFVFALIVFHLMLFDKATQLAYFRPFQFVKIEPVALSIPNLQQIII